MYTTTSFVCRVPVTYNNIQNAAGEVVGLDTAKCINKHVKAVKLLPDNTGEFTFTV